MKNKIVYVLTKHSLFYQAVMDMDTYLKKKKHDQLL